MAQAVELVELLPGKLYFASSPSGSPPLSSSAACHAPVQLVDVTRTCRYVGFELDFGPFSLGHAVKFARHLDALLARSEAHADARVCVFVSSKSSSKSTKASSHAQQQCANAVCVLGCWAVLSRGWSAERAFAPFSHLPLALYHDATRGPDSFGLSVLHILRGLEKAVHTQLVSFATFSVDEFVHYAHVARGDLSWISPQFVAFAGPHDSSSVSSSGRLPPEHYVPHFQQHGVALVVRLSRKRYDKKRFTTAGFAFADLYFPDGTTPPDAVLHEFLELCANTATGAIAVHCKAGLGRTGTLIACSLMQRYRFSAEEAIGWLRLCRPGSIVGQQQHYLRAKQQQLWDSSPVLAKEPPLTNTSTSSTAESERTAGVCREGIAARPRRRLSLSAGGCTLLKKVDQLRHSSGGLKSSHSISPVGSATSSGVPKPPRIPPKASRPLAGTEQEDASMNQGDLLMARKLVQQRDNACPAVEHRMTGLWPLKRSAIM